MSKVKYGLAALLTIILLVLAVTHIMGAEVVSYWSLMPTQPWFGWFGWVGWIFPKFPWPI
ncbi:MAG: hypothetical protein ACTSSA_03065 [Candidatus Freyarchaeota archaeon]